MNNYHNILTFVTLGVTGSDGKDFRVMINPVITQEENGNFATTGIFALHNDIIGLNLGDLNNKNLYELTDNKNPYYLGKILFDDKDCWIYDGDSLSIYEQEQIAEFISTYEEGDVLY